MTGMPVTHFEILGRDPAALRAFYADAFGWRIGAETGGYTMAFPDAGRGIDGGIGAAPPGSGGHATFYVEVGDLDGSLERVEACGGRILLGPQHVPSGPSFALVADPEGHVLGLARRPT